MRNRAHSTSYLTDGLQAWACDPRHYGELSSDDVYIILGKAAIVNRNGKSYTEINFQITRTMLY